VREIVKNDNYTWKEVFFSVGSKGSVIGHEKIFRVMDIRNGLPKQ
jgi:hypothetical protein